MFRISKKLGDNTCAVRRPIKEKNVENSSAYMMHKKQDFDAINFNKRISYNLYYY